MNDFKVTLWLHTSMTYDEVASSVEEILPTASYLVEDQNAPSGHRFPKLAITPGSETIEVRDKLL